ncbi:MAG: hypothetical protein H7A48_13050 [Akkermansiaceae bacterium]|nr:hypothetical protein [Akkermansiaceae bacterium]
MTVPPAVESAILAAGKARMAAVRAKRRSRTAFRLLWPVAAAACFLLVWLVLTPPPPAAHASRQAYEKEKNAAAILLREFSALYPNQIRAIIQNDSGIQLELAENTNVKSGRPVLLKVCEPEGCEEIITFGGQSIEVAGHQVTVRTDAEGRVILDGDQLIWSSDLKRNPAPGIHIESHRL